MAVPTITIVGNLGMDPELRTSANGTVYARVFVIASSRKRDNQTGEWKDGDTLAIGGVVFGNMAQNVASSLAKGMRVIVQGRLRNSNKAPQDQSGSRGPADLLIEEIGPALSNATAQVTRQSSGSGFSGGNRGGFAGNSGNAGNGGFAGNGGYQGGAGYSGGYTGGASVAPAAQQAPAAPAADPWGTSSSSQSGSSFGSFGSSDDFGGDSEEPEF